MGFELEDKDLWKIGAIVAMLLVVILNFGFVFF